VQKPYLFLNIQHTRIIKSLENINVNLLFRWYSTFAKQPTLIKVRTLSRELGLLKTSLYYLTKFFTLYQPTLLPRKLGKATKNWWGGGIWSHRHYRQKPLPNVFFYFSFLSFFMKQARLRTLFTYKKLNLTTYKFSFYSISTRFNPPHILFCNKGFVLNITNTNPPLGKLVKYAIGLRLVFSSQIATLLPIIQVPLIFSL
jgi:hypothetical protein